MSSDSDAKFRERRRLLTDRADAAAVARRLHDRLAAGSADELRAALSEQHPADLADAMRFLSEAEDEQVFAALRIPEAAEVLDEVDRSTKRRLARAAAPERLAAILVEMPPDEAADAIAEVRAGADRNAVIAAIKALGVDPAPIQTLLEYPADTAGGIMSLGYVAVPETATVTQALEMFRAARHAEHIFYVYVTDSGSGGLRGRINLRSLFSADLDDRLENLTEISCLSVPPEMDREQVAAIFARYDMTALPVVGPEPECRLLGVVVADDVIDVLRAEADEDVAQLSGSDAQELERKTPAQVARLRLPWIMTTMFIELLAGFVIRVFNPTLDKYLLLASFMPIISAISGNTGLQSAAIIIRGLSTGQVSLSGWKHAVVRQVETTMMLGGACAAVLGIIGAIWDRHLLFGLVVFLGMFLSVNIAGLVGTVIPLVSKRLGFDPALTAGPFETAFQDVVGISIFLSLASALLKFVH